MKTLFKAMTGTAILLAASHVYASQDQASEAAGQAASEGQVLFETHCVSCHKAHKKGKKGGKGHGEQSEGEKSSGQKSGGEKGGHGEHSKGTKPDGEKSGGKKGGHAKRLAPPMEMVKKHYLKDYPEREVFIDKVSAWVAAPKAEGAMLSRAVDKFGLMPPLPVDESIRTKIAAYIYDELAVGECGCKGGGKEHGGEEHGDGKKGGGEHKGEKQGDGSCDGGKGKGGQKSGESSDHSGH